MPRKTICLNMIVKNEAHLIAETLAHLLTYMTFDYWVISDTGSTDKTKEIIIDFFKSRGIAGELVEHAWKDFGYNRSKAFESAYNKTDYAFVWDADDEISGSFKMPTDLTADSYMFTFGNSDGFRYSRHQLFNNRKRWCYKGVLHEYAACLEPNGPSVSVSGDYFFISGRRGDRSKDPNKYLKDALILEKASEKALAEKDPLYNRYVFYCAQSYSSCNMHEKAIEVYKKALSIEMWVQEKYVSCIEIYEQYERLGKQLDALPYLVESYKYDPERIECIYRLIKYYCVNGQIEVSYMYYSLIQDFYENRYDGQKLSEKLFAKKAEYDFYLPYYMIITAEKAKKLETAAKMYEAIVKHGFLVGEWWIRNLVFNMQFCFSALPKTIDFFYKFMDYLKKARGAGITFEPVHINVISRLIELYRPLLAISDKKLIKPSASKPIKVMMTFTTCKRLDLFQQTINSILNSWTDIDKVDYFFCVDDNSSQRDRTKMRDMCPFMNFHMKGKAEKGHRASMNIIYDKLKEVQPAYWIHMEDDWVFFEKAKYVQNSIDFLDKYKEKGIHQILYNRNYAETYDGWDINGSEPLEKGFLLHVKSDAIPGRNCAYWPHYSFRPSMIRVSTIMELGNYDSVNAFFERDYADKYFAKGYKSAFFDTVSSLHIGKLTSDKSGENAYTMNGVGQFGDMDKKSPNAFVVNLLRRTDRKEAVEIAFDAASIKESEYEFIEAFDGKELLVTDEINTLFAGNDFGSRKGVIGCALSHYGLWKQLAADTSNEYYTIFEDDIQLVDGFKASWAAATTEAAAVATLSSSDADMIFLGYHVRDVHKGETRMPYENNFRSLDTNIYIGGFFAYIITKKGSQKMLDYIATNGIKHGIDYLVKVVPGFKSYNCQPHIVLSDWVTSSASPVDTDIQKDFSSLQIETKVNSDEWTFYEGVDSGGGDIRRINGPISEIMKAASAESKCVAFNTLGFLKITVAELKATPYISAAGTGIYIRKPSSKYLISSYLCGGLGNRLFQISAALGLAEITGQKVVFYSNQANSISHQDINNIYKMFPDIQVLKDAGDVDLFYEEKNKHFTFKTFPQTKKNTVIHGYRQSPLYLPSTGVHPVLGSEDLYAKYGLDTDEGRLNSWFIHIRLGDYKTNGCVNHITVETYHKHILHNIPDGVNVILFSDEPIAAENQLKKYFNHEVRVCSETDEVKCLGLMSQCWGGAIVPNSTFSWWGAYLAHQASSCPDSFKAYFPTKWNTEIPGSIKNHCIPSWGIGIDPIEKDECSKTYTIAGRTDGFGGQYQGIMSGIAICEYNKYRYVHTPLINVEASSDVGALNKLIGIPSSNPEIPMIREVFSNEVHYSKTPSIYYTPSVISKIREWYYMTEKPMIEPVDIAIHIRRGNVNSKVHSDRYTSNETYANIIRALKAKYPSYKIHIFSEGSIDDFVDLEADSFRLNEDICKTFHSMICAKVLVTARSSLSYSAAILNANTVYYHDFWHAPLDNWLSLNLLKSDNTIRYSSGGMLGDFIHQISIINENYLKTGKKGILYLSSKYHDFRLGIERAYKDTEEFIKSQPYIHEYKIHNGEPYDINLSSWRNNPLIFKTNWYNLFKAEYGVEWGSHPWLYTSVKKPEFNNIVLFNSVMTRFPEKINYTKLFDEYGKENVRFITENINEYTQFKDKTGIELEVYIPSSISDFIHTINSCKLFIGTQSSPLTYAYGLQKNSITLINHAHPDAVFVNNLEHILPGITIIRDTVSNLPSEEWIFYEGLDSGGADIGRCNPDITILKAAASADPNCVAFNTLGFLKSYVKFPLIKSPYIHAPGGLYVKKSYKPPIRVKMLCNWCSSEDLCKEWLKMTKGSYKWNDLEITWSDDADYYVIINKPQPGAKFVPEKTIIFHMEPWCDSPQQNWGVKTWGEWAKPDPSKFLQVRSHDRFLNPGFWQINLTYSQLKEMDMIKYKYEDKSKIVSSICSSKYFDPGHKKRIDFLKFVEAKGGVNMHIYNEDNQHGFKSYQGTARPSVDKEKGLVPYKYYFMCENNVEANFITEKLWEPILCEALCFYWGCPNVADHVDPMAYVQLNMDDFDASYNIMNAAIETNLWEERLPYIKKAKQRILDEQGFFPMLEKALKPKAVCFIHSCHLASAGTEKLDLILKAAIGVKELEAIIINNIGLPLDSKYTSLDSRIQVIQCSSDPALFELPTLRLIHEFSLTSPNTKILYLHTKGISYPKGDPRYENGLDWINYMLHFLCTKSDECIKLLDSHDVAGCNFSDLPKPHFSGNFWWATSKYLKTLDTELLTDKMSAEWWLLSKSAKKSLLWQSSKNHFLERYSKEEYNIIRYLSGGKLGDFIHQLSIINENYLKTGKKGILYITDLQSAGDKFTFGLERAYNDTKEFIKSQPYIHDYKLHKGEPYDINLSSWRNNPLIFKTNWYNLFKAEYGVEWGTHPWLYAIKKPEFNNIILFNCVMARFPENINFTRLFDEYGKDNIIFITQTTSEYRQFIDKTGIELQVYIASSIEDFIDTVNSCKLFIGTQSSPLTYAYGLHKNNISLIIQDSIESNFVKNIECILAGTIIML